MIEWSPSLSIGIPRVDAQHQELVKAFNDLQAAMREGKGSENVVPLLRFLGQYAVSHFSVEESLMRLHQYPGLEAHRAAHEEFKADFGQLLMETESTKHRVAKTMQVSGRLLEWLFSHIKRMDKEMGTYLAARGAR